MYDGDGEVSGRRPRRELTDSERLDFLKSLDLMTIAFIFASQDVRGAIDESYFCQSDKTREVLS